MGLLTCKLVFNQHTVIAYIHGVKWDILIFIESMKNKSG